ncbi:MULTISPECIES: leucine-rich repeat domain-containing protein [Streptosporangium]|uniref:Leucine-rich repeat domain-containing protein n=1 Tax=Streptosporangium brasiliense TaxID=47480 RepID=A0ABT9R9Y6_9ACTN|nr:leucine-rich repeat domain-containing protein [Streptosporangium brasiliense]MDP9866057.1 hypothetical protein [Streptosporangium brasiliense]
MGGIGYDEEVVGDGISRCLSDGSTVLGMPWQHIDVLPEPVNDGLTHVVELDLSHNRLTALPESLTGLSRIARF